MIGYCKDCKHWRSFNDERVEKPRPYAWNGEASNQRKLGLCMKVDIDQEVWHRDVDANNKAPLDDEDPPLEAGHLALAQDLSGCAGLRTDAEFGCVLFEPTWTTWGTDK